jgi:hypothetical protein
MKWSPISPQSKIPQILVTSTNLPNRNGLSRFIPGNDEDYFKESGEREARIPLVVNASQRFLRSEISTAPASRVKMTGTPRRSSRSRNFALARLVAGNSESVMMTSSG